MVSSICVITACLTLTIFMWENKSKSPLENSTNVSEEKERERRGGREGESVFDVLIQSKYMISQENKNNNDEII